MAKLSFIDELDENQLAYAEKIAAKAKEMGVPPKLAVAIAYHESRLNPNAPRGADGEFGGMQVMPKTGKGLGYTNKDLADPEKNIEAGLKYLKQNLDAFGGDPKMATVGYNAGTDSSFFSGGDLPKVTEDYVKAMKGYGAYDEAQAEQNNEPVLVNAPPAPPPTADTSGASTGERFLGGAIGAGVGTLASGAQGVSNVRTGMAATRAGAEETARIAAQRAAGVTPPAAPGTPGSVPPGGPKPPLGSTIMRQPGAPTTGFNLQPPVGPADAGRMAKGQTGVIPYNTGKALGLTDIEAGQALTNTKQEGGAWNLAEKRAEGMNKVQSLFPGEKYVENPRYGGLLTLDQGVGSGPRESFSMKPAVPPSPEVPKGQPGGLSQLPPRQPISTAPIAPKGPSGLDAVTDMFKGMMRPVTTAAKTIGKYALPPLAGLSAGLDLAEVGHEYDKPSDQRDYTKMGLKAASAIGGGLSMFPPTAPVGIPLSLGATAAQAYRENPDFLDQMRNRIGEMPYSDPMGYTP
jgi:hypothetical protein